MLAAILINNPLQTIRIISVFCAIVFGIFGFILLYLNMKLPEYARGNRLWMLFIGIGSLLSVIIALALEGNLLNYGIPLIKNIAICLIAVYIFIKTKTFRHFVSGTATGSDKLWLIFLFSLFSILGSGLLLGTETDIPGVFITFTALGPILAGFLGGPGIGCITGLIGGAVSFAATPGMCAVPCFISAVAGGIAAGVAIRIWNGKLTFLRGGILTAAVGCLHIFTIFPLYVLLTGALSPGMIILAVTVLVLPMLSALLFGVLFFIYFTRKQGDIREPANSTGLREKGAVTDMLKGLVSWEKKK